MRSPPLNPPPAPRGPVAPPATTLLRSAFVCAPQPPRQTPKLQPRSPDDAELRRRALFDSRGTSESEGKEPWNFGLEMPPDELDLQMPLKKSVFKCSSRTRPARVSFSLRSRRYLVETLRSRSLGVSRDAKTFAISPLRSTRPLNSDALPPASAEPTLLPRAPFRSAASACLPAIPSAPLRCCGFRFWKQTGA